MKAVLCILNPAISCVQEVEIATLGGKHLTTYSQLPLSYGLENCA